MKARIPKHREFIIDFPKEVSQEKADEGCLSLTGTRKTKRHKVIKVQWQNEKDVLFSLCFVLHFNFIVKL